MTKTFEAAFSYDIAMNNEGIVVMTNEALAAWVQAVGSIAAILAGFVMVRWQALLTQKTQEQEREDRAQVVAFRISVWIGEVASRLQLVAEAFNSIQHTHAELDPKTFAPRLKLMLISSIESVMPDLHFLPKGTGDLAQLDCHIRFWDAWLDRVGELHPWDAAKQAETFENAAMQLANIQKLHQNAMRHIEPLIDKGILIDR